MECRAYGNLGRGYTSQGDYAKAIDYHKLCLKIAKEGGDREAEGKAYANLAVALTAKGNLREAAQAGVSVCECVNV